MFDLRFDPAELRPLMEEVARAVLREIDSSRTFLVNGKLAIPEPEAAELLGLHSWQLRDLRLSGKIGFRRIVGNRVRYTPDDLQKYLKALHQPGI